MMFADRQDAGQSLASLLQKQKEMGWRKKTMILSLLKGGAIIGETVAGTLKKQHIPLPVVKIRSPYNDEFAIGAVCFDEVFLNNGFIEEMRLTQDAIDRQIKDALQRHVSYAQTVNMSKEKYTVVRKNIAIVVDDGVATGTTARTAIMFLKRFSPKRIVFAAPVAPHGTSIPGADKTLILQTPMDFGAVSSFYKVFPHVTEEEIRDMFIQ